MSQNTRQEVLAQAPAAFVFAVVAGVRRFAHGELLRASCLPLPQSAVAARPGACFAGALQTMHWVVFEVLGLTAGGGRRCMRR